MAEKCFPSSVRFKGAWRPYQARVLAALDEHLDDRRVHVIAAPGSGKTVLGLEIVLRLNRPALVISPTLAIRDQWIQRFTELFFPDGSPPPAWISTDVRQPALLTSTTYQALHMACSGRPQEAAGGEEPPEEADESAHEDTAPETSTPHAGELVGLLNRAGIETLVVDEAHHLRNEWWKTLTQVREQLKRVRVVSLTATPPYDVGYQEWTRYQEFCGPVDEEISVPELVLDGNLCPHQDYVYLSEPAAGENERIDAFRRDVAAFCAEIVADAAFAGALERHPAIVGADTRIENILAAPEYYSAMVIFLRRAGRDFPRRILSILGVDRAGIPPLTMEWLEILLTHALYGNDDLLPLPEEEGKRLRQRLSRMGAVDRRSVFLKNTKQVAKALVQSVGKLESIVEIVRLEHGVLQDGLRLVVLSDYIRREDLPPSPSDLKSPARLGVIPIFETLRRKLGPEVRLGCLCGTVVIVPSDSQPALRRIADGRKIRPGQIIFKPLACDPRYAEVVLEGLADEQAVALITRLFVEGGVTVLVGTKSLLGEGWDAPCINALILASFVGSFVLSNQMRGRAIRICGTDGRKTANVWHLVCLQKARRDPFAPDREPDLGPDWEMLQRRFRAFVGVSNVEPVIENGFRRLGLKVDDSAQAAVSNRGTLEQARDRKRLCEKWEEALKRGADGVRMAQEIEAPREIVPRGFVFQNTIRWLLFQAAYWGLYLFLHLQLNNRAADSRQVLTVFAVVGGLSLALAAPFLVKAAWIYLRYGPVEGSLRRMGEAVLKTLTFCDLIKTDPARMGVTTSTASNGWVSCCLQGGSSFEKTVFLDALEQVLGPIENPRYLLTRHSTLLFFARKDYHPVPEILGERKDRAEYFKKMWEKYVGPAGLIYTRTPEGRRILVRARSRSLSGQFTRRSERLNIWK